LARSQELLEAADFTLKGEDGVQDLRQGQSALVLGFKLSRRATQLHFEPGPDSWTKLEQNLVKAHEMPVPSLTAQEVVKGWIGAMGPAFENWRTAPVGRVQQLAASLGFRKIGSREAFGTLCERSWKHWETFRKGVTQASGTLADYGQDGQLPPATSSRASR
jgi:hypothetical protein